DLCFDPRQDFFPEVHVGQTFHVGEHHAGAPETASLRVVFHPVGRRKLATLAGNPPKTAGPLEFPQFFPQVWKTLGRDRRRMSRRRHFRTMKDADSNTPPVRLTPLEAVR